MAGVNIRVRILLCPHDSRKAVPGNTWPHVAGIPVQVTGPVGAAGAGRVEDLGETDRHGYTTRRELDRGIWELDVPGGAFQTATLDLTQARATDTREVTLIPRDERWLVLLQLTQEPAGTGVAGADVQISAPDGTSRTFTASTGGQVYASAPEGRVTLEPQPVDLPDGKTVIPSDPVIAYTVEESDVISVLPITYWRAIQISVEPTVKTPAGNTVPLTDATATVDYRGAAGVSSSSETQSLAQGSAISFEYASPGVYVITVAAPSLTPDGLPIKKVPPQVTTEALSGGDSLTVGAEFEVVTTKPVVFRVSTPQNKPLNNDLRLQIVGPGNAMIPVAIPVAVQGRPFTTPLPVDDTLLIQLDPDPATTPKIGNIPLTMAVPGQKLGGSDNTVALEYLHSITGRAVDEHGLTVSGAVIDVFDQDGQELVDTVITDDNGGFTVGLETEGTYFLAQHPAGGEVERLERIEVHSRARTTVAVRTGPRHDREDGGEALTDLSAYPVLTEEVSTTGIPAPTDGGGGGGGGGRGAGYGQAVDQAIRDVLGWRPGGDVAGFQAALTGAFQLSEVEGHTNWAWQQRGYAVQADMGALTGAQASIYARAKSALDQMLPLLAGLTAINPALYPPQDLEAIRTVVTAELQELVSELALEGGPRIQRVDELFSLLLGAGITSKNLNPDLVQGQLGTLRDRFGLTANQIDTVDEERIVTNFRIVVEQVLSLKASWTTDRGLLSPLNPQASLGTILIWLSRSLEAVGDSVGDLMFALDSVYVDAAQRQVVELRLGPGEPVLLLSDLLDWVVRASRDEGPRIIQDAGKDGVFAFAPVLTKLQSLIQATHQVVRTDRRLPAGLRTPRVDRALSVLTDQLTEAAKLARQVRRDALPMIDQVTSVTANSDAKTITVNVTGNNFRPGASAVLLAENREDLPELSSRSVQATVPGTATATFRDPRRVPGGATVTWLLVITNDDGAQSNPAAIQMPSSS